jgi:hypothetical protein
MVWTTPCKQILLLHLELVCWFTSVMPSGTEAVHWPSFAQYRYYQNVINDLRFWLRSIPYEFSAQSQILVNFSC